MLQFTLAWNVDSILHRISRIRCKYLELLPIFEKYLKSNRLLHVISRLSVDRVSWQKGTRLYPQTDDNHL